MRSRWVAYAGVSVTLAAGVILKALHQRPNFYSAAVYLAQSSANLMILTNLIFLTACSLLLGLQKLLFGPLRPIEVEQLYEKAWFAVTETCLAMTIFRGEIGGWFLVMFFSLLAAKVWGWIGEGRVEVLEQQPPQNPRLFHTRLAISLSLSVLFDSYMLEYLVKEVLHQARPDMMVMFGFEFAVLTILSTSTMARYAISLVEIYIVRKQKEKRIEEIKRERREAAAAAVSAPSGAADASATADATPQVGAANSLAAPTTAPPSVDEPIDDADLEVEGWEEKGRWIFYLDLSTDFLKLVVYLSFFFILLVFYGLPIHIMRDVFLTCRSFFKRIADFMKYRTATRDMNERYPDATAEEIAREDTCIICREEMRPLAPAVDANGVPRAPNPVAERMRPKKLPCGHILHFACLRSWLERQQICPTCRRPVVPVIRIQVGGSGQPAANAGAGEPNAAVAGQGAPDQAQQGGGGQLAEGQNRLRMLNFGPLRIGFGAGRGDLVNDLAQQIHNEQPRPAPAANQDRAQQYGFGFRFGRVGAPQPAQPVQPARSETASLHSQISAVEQRLHRDISELRMAANELHVVHMLEAEFSRLRALRQAAAGQPGATIPATSQPALHSGPLLSSTRPAQALVGNAQQPILAAGSEGLPEGLTLPPGWSMMPLQRVEGLGQHIPNGQPAPLVQPIPLGQPTAPPMSTSASAPPSSTSVPQPASQQTTVVSNGSTAQPLVVTSSSSQSRPDPGTSSGQIVSSDTVSTLFGGDVFERFRQDTAAPAQVINSGTGQATSPPTSHQETIIRFPSPPTWGSNTPLANPIASQPAASGGTGQATSQPASHQETNIRLPSPPTWGSNNPLANPIASQPAATSNGENSTNGDHEVAAARTEVAASDSTEDGVNVNGTSTTEQPQTQAAQAQPEPQSTLSKGKQKAATVEDFVENVD